MFNDITHSSIYVLDQDAAIDFYVDTLGMEVRSDFDLGFMRWLTVGVPGDPREILLERPGPPAHDDKTAAEIQKLVSKGALLGVILSTDDCRQTFDELVSKGVDITQEPIEQPYGVDCAIRDPFGNNIRITEPAAGPVEITEEVKERWAGVK